MPRPLLLMLILSTGGCSSLPLPEELPWFSSAPPAKQSLPPAPDSLTLPPPLPEFAPAPRPTSTTAMPLASFAPPPTPAPSPAPAVATPIVASAPATMAAASPYLQKEAVLAVVERWRRAWAERDSPSYFGCYQPGYTHGRRSAILWQQERIRDMAGSGEAIARIDETVVRIESTDRATVRFHWYAQTGRAMESGSKELRLTRLEDQWLISHESVLSDRQASTPAKEARLMGKKASVHKAHACHGRCRVKQ